ncbi:MAG: hypothetical protein ACLGIG_06860 [Actinomycetes bacterium]
MTRRRELSVLAGGAGGVADEVWSLECVTCMVDVRAATRTRLSTVMAAHHAGHSCADRVTVDYTVTTEVVRRRRTSRPHRLRLDLPKQILAAACAAGTPERSVAS